ncbi:hypothetical protein K435DRAFT_811011 [Dendrothele bispora CBS 962.96]|uniref:Uncharacterized protein n=1 Tax=Dendrothele bispora (strain CBS 962.96) TaxID=1314807 RepID=A0A4S8KTL8_DENBC|nr:hypothetical protein K435DRAFT_811011 [Dendrothele bispora CBS 962.96]
MSALPDRPTPVSQDTFATFYGNNILILPSLFNFLMTLSTYNIGGILICGFIAIFFYGISVLQSSGASYVFGPKMYMYFLNYQKDTWWIKLLVLLIGTITTIQSGFLCQLIYHYVVSNTYSLEVKLPATQTYQFWILDSGLRMFAPSWIDEGWDSETHLNAGSSFGLCWVVKEFQSATFEEFIPWAPKLLIPHHVLRMISDIATTSSLCLILYDIEVHFKR